MRAASVDRSNPYRQILVERLEDRIMLAADLQARLGGEGHLRFKEDGYEHWGAIDVRRPAARQSRPLRS